jgi:plastocyanin
MSEQRPTQLRRPMFAHLVAALATLGFLALPSSPAWAAKEVLVDDDFFSPGNVIVAVGGQVHWSRAVGSTDLHNVRQDDELFDSGAATVGPIDLTATVSAGTYHYYCEIHGSPSGGMHGIVKSSVKILDAPAGLKFTVRWATDATDTGSLHDVQYRIGSGDWKNWKKDTGTNEGVFGKNGNPVTVKDGKKYGFRARSQEGSGLSDWSPVKSHTA